MKIPFIVQRKKNVTLSLFCTCCTLLILVVSGCGDSSSSSDVDNDLSNTGSYACTLTWPEDVPTLESTSIDSRAIDCDAAGVATVAFTFYDGSGSYLTGDEWSCSLHEGTVYGIPAGTNRRLVVTGKDASGAMLYWGEETGITIVAGQTTQGGEIEMEYVYGTAPSAPTNVTATAGDEEVTVSWDSVSGATSYNIYWSTDSGVSNTNYESKIEDITTTSYTHSGLTSGTTYYYVITAENDYGESGESSEVNTTPQVSIVPTDGLVAYYPFNGNSNDESGNGNNGTVYGATLTEDRFGNLDSAYSFDGVDDYIDIGNNVKPNFPITVSTWIKINNNEHEGYIFRNDQVNRSSYRYGLAVEYHRTGRIYSHVFEGFSASWNRRTTYSDDGVASIGDWHNFTVVFHRHDNMELFWDAVKVNSYNEGSGSTMTYSNSNGAIGNETATYNLVNGDIDDIRIYNRALSESEIQALYAGTAPSAPSGHILSLLTPEG